MKILVQWTTSQPGDWQEVDSSDWHLLPKKGAPALGGGIPSHDNAPGWIAAINVQGVVIAYRDNYAIEEIGDGSGGIRVYFWDDDPDDWALVDDRHAHCWTFYPLAPDPELGGAWNTRQSVEIFAGRSTTRPLPPPGGNRTFRALRDFVPPASQIVRHGAWARDDHWVDLKSALSLRCYSEWTDGVPSSLIGPDGMLVNQRAAGLYKRASGTRTYYTSSTVVDVGYETAFYERGIYTSTTTAGWLNMSVAKGKEDITVFTGYVANEPGKLYWPGGTYRYSLEIGTVGADITYFIGTLGSEDGGFYRVTSDYSTLVERHESTNPSSAQSGSGTTVFNYENSNWSASGSSTDRLGLGVAAANGHSKDAQVIYIRSGDDWADGPWASGSGETYERAISDSAVASDTVATQKTTSGQTYERNATDSVVVADQVTVVCECLYERTVNDDEAVTDSVTTEMELLRPYIDEEDVADTVATAVNYERSIVDNEAAVDTVAREAVFELTIVDGETVSDSVSASREYSISIYDAVAVADSPATNSEFARSIADAESATDSVTREKTGGELYERSAQDAESVTDSVATIRSRFYDILVPPVGVDTIPPISDKCNRIESIEVTFEREVVDDLTPPEVQINTVTYVGLVRWANIADSESATDALSLETVFARSVADSETATDSVSIEVQFSRDASDSESVTDGVDRHLSVEVSVADSESNSDQIFVESEFERSDSDSVAIVDQILREVWFERSVSDNEAVVDQVTEDLIEGNIPINDAVACSDQVAIALEFGRNIADTAALLDLVGTESWVQRGITSSESVSDSVYVGKVYYRTIGDSESLADSLLLEGDYGRILPYSISVDDDISREAWYHKLLNDSLNVVDECTLVNIEESISLSDSVLAVVHGTLNEPVPVIDGKTRLKVKLRFKYSKNGIVLEQPRKGAQDTFKYKVNGDYSHKNVQVVGTTAELISSGRVTAGGFLLLKNLDNTNYISLVENYNLTSAMKLKPGDIAFFRSGSDILTDYKVVADTANCNMLVLWVDE